MSTLHTLSQSWFESTWLYEQLAFASEGDSIMLMQDAVLAVQSSIALASFIAKCRANRITVYALKGDIQLRGIDQHPAELELVDYDGFVKLVAENDKQVAW